MIWCSVYQDFMADYELTNIDKERSLLFFHSFSTEHDVIRRSQQLVMNLLWCGTVCWQWGLHEDLEKHEHKEGKQEKNAANKKQAASWRKNSSDTTFTPGKKCITAIIDAIVQPMGMMIWGNLASTISGITQNIVNPQALQPISLKNKPFEIRRVM